MQKKRNCHKQFREMLVHELVQPYLDDKKEAAVHNMGRPSLEPASVSKVDVLDATRLSGTHYPSKMTPGRKCCMCAYKNQLEYRTAK